MKLIFKHSTSKKLPEALKLASNFDFENKDDIVVNLTVQVIFEKWEYFNKLFWIVNDWKGTAIEMDSFVFYSKTDRLRIFYALQLSHAKWINFIEMKTFYLFEDGKIKDGIEISSKEADYLISLYHHNKNSF